MHSPDARYPSINIYTPSILHVLQGLNVDLDVLLSTVALKDSYTTREYPDRSIQVEGDAANKIDKVIRDHLRIRVMAFWEANPLSNEDVLGNEFFSSLSPFPPTEIAILNFGEFVRKLETGKVRIRPVLTALRPSVGENPIDDLLVTVLFQRRMSKDSRRQFAGLIDNWLASVRQEGIFGDGPVVMLSREIDFFPRGAQFRIDASHSGQHTINWLILSILHFHPVNLVTDIFLVRNGNNGMTIAQEFGLSEDQVIREPITTNAIVDKNAPNASGPLPTSTGATQEESSELPFANVPVGATPYEGLASDSFRLLVVPGWHLENLWVTICFEESPRGEDRKLFKQSIESWLQLGSLGAFGGNGFDAHNDLVFEARTSAARFWCDVGVTDWNFGLKALVSLLEGWHRRGLSIATVVFSSPDSEM